MTTCPSCQNTVLVGRFCAVCGLPLTVPGAQASTVEDDTEPIPVRAGPWSPSSDTAVETAPAEVLPAVGSAALDAAFSSSPAAVPPTGPRKGRSSRSIGAVAVTAALLAVAAYVVVTGSERHTVTGEMFLTDSSSFSDLSDGDSCEGSGGYDDMNSGTQLVIEDQTGKTLSTASYGSGTYDGTACVFGFEFTDVPKATFYRVQQSGNRGVLQYSYQDMVKNHWGVSLTLGEGD